MTREAVLEGFDEFIGDAIEETIDEFSVTRALQNGIQGPGSSLVDNLVKNSNRLQSKVIEPELRQYRDQTYEQFHVILEYAESDANIDAYREDILAVGAFENRLKSDLPESEREGALESLLARHRRLGDAIVPLLESEHTDFWDAARDELTGPQADTLVEEHFAFTDPLVRHSECFRLAVDVKTTDVLGGFGLLLGGTTITVEYTDEAFRSLQRAEQEVIGTAKDHVDRLFE